MVLITLLSALEIFPDFGPMRTAERRARETGKVLRDGAVPMVGAELEELQKGGDSDVKPNVTLDFLVPILIMVATGVWSYVARGGVKILECLIITVLYMSIELCIRRVFRSVKDLVDTAVQGMKSVMSATLILALAYCINTITEAMGAADFILEATSGWMTPVLFLTVTFLVGAVISFFTGSSWGTYAICIPLGGAHGLFLHRQSAGSAGVRCGGRGGQRRPVRRPLLPGIGYHRAVLPWLRL